MILLEEDCFYHVYNRANGHNDKVFLNDGNYTFFLLRYQKYLSIYIDLYCYCLMPNHFHLLIKVKKIPNDFQGFSADKYAHFLSNQFSKFFNSYAKAFNKQNKRKGSVFMKNFKRKKASDIKYIQTLVRYIHNNPVEARLVSKPWEWKYSSYLKIKEGDNELVKSNEVIQLFDDIRNFENLHFFGSEIETEI